MHGLPSNTNRLLLQIAALLCLLTLLSAPAAAADPAQLAAQGRQALDAQRFEESLAVFRAGRNDAEFSEDWQQKFLFYEAVALQQQAQSRSGDERQALLKQAAQLYADYIRLKPKSAAAYNNLGKTHELYGDIEAAGHAYRRAITFAGKRKTLYQQNYANLLEKSGKLADAAKVKESLALANPLADAPHKAVLNAYLESGDEHALQTYAWRLFDAGQPRRAAQSALDALGQRRLRPEIKESLLTLVCAALSHNVQPPSKFRASSFAVQLAALENDPDIAEGVAQLLKLYEVSDDSNLAPRDFGWWRKGDIANDPPFGMWPLDGFRAYARALGTWHKRRNDMQQAERYFHLAIGFVRREPDPAAFRELVDLYVRSNQFDKVLLLSDRYQRRIFAAKSSAYRTSNYEKIYEFHRTLGELYSFLGRWGSESESTTAIFQLDHARRISMRLAEERGAALPERYRFTPTMTHMLSRAYAETGNLNASYQVRLEQAETYQRLGAVADARKVLQPITGKPLPPELNPAVREYYSAMIGKPDLQDTGSMPAPQRPRPEALRNATTPDTPEIIFNDGGG